MSLDLNKKSEKITALLLDKGIKKAPTMRVGVALDISGSMHSIIHSGQLQSAFDQMMGVSVTFDDDGELDVFKFDHNCEYVGTSSPNIGDYDSYIENNNIKPRGGTAYAPIVKEAVEFFFKPKKKMFGLGSTQYDTSGDPVLMLIITDGEPSDADSALSAMEKHSHLPIYYHLVGVGGTRRSFPTIARLADELPNVGEVYLPDLNQSDDSIYNQLICDELIEWIK